MRPAVPLRREVVEPAVIVMRCHAVILTQAGWVMSAGTTQASKSSPATPDAIAASRRVVPSRWAFLAIAAARVVTDVRVERGHEHEVGGQVVVDPLRIGSYAAGTVLVEGATRVAEQAGGLEHRVCHDRLEDVEFEVALAAREGHGRVVAEDRVQTMVRASLWVGLTLPGMIEEPGSFSGMVISPIPLRGPLASQRTSLAIFIAATANPRRAALTATRASCADRAAKRFVACRNSKCVSSERCCATSEPKSRCVLRPVPTAVPRSPIRPDSPRRAGPPRQAASNCATQAEISWPSVIGVASWRWVRPTLTSPAYSLALASRVSRRASTGHRASRAVRAGWRRAWPSGRCHCSTGPG